jgi:hypothetical protein
MLRLHSHIRVSSLSYSIVPTQMQANMTREDISKWRQDQCKKRKAMWQRKRRDRINQAVEELTAQLPVLKKLVEEKEAKSDVDSTWLGEVLGEAKHTAGVLDDFEFHPGVSMTTTGSTVGTMKSSESHQDFEKFLKEITPMGPRSDDDAAIKGLNDFINEHDVEFKDGAQDMGIMNDTNQAGAFNQLPDIKLGNGDYPSNDGLVDEVVSGLIGDPEETWVRLDDTV